jgi:drug/metabolite transporter (DMT)-like permease
MILQIKNRETKGILCKLLNLFLYAVVTILNKNFLKSLGIFQLFFLSSFFALIFITIFIKFSKEKSLFDLIKGINTKYLTRGLLNMMGRTFWLFGLAEMDATIATTIAYLRPIFALLIAIFFLSEKMTWKLGSALLISIIGAILVIGPAADSDGASTISIIAIFSSPLAWAIYDIIVKKQSRKDHWAKQTFIVFFLSVLFSFPLAITNWEPLNSNLFLIIILIGFLYTSIEVTLAIALKRLALTLVAPISFTRIVFTAILAYIFIGEEITMVTSIGCLLIIAANLVIFATVSEKKVTELKAEDPS